MSLAPTPTTNEAMAATALEPASVGADDPAWASKPNVAGFTFIGGKKEPWTLSLIHI